MRLRMPVDRATFLSDYWQKKPLLMRGALDPELFAVSPEELAGLACDPEVESRLVVQNAEQDWSLQHGPFEEDHFATLPETAWTLLVQDVDKYREDVTRLLDCFDFVPAWRVDDIMISYATHGGGVGPHSDAYDVFLMQAEGCRRWRVSTSNYTDDDLLRDQPLRVLGRFDVGEDWVLEPGDVLYLPPGVAHWGTAEGDCMTYSLGFRSPQAREMLTEWLQHLAEKAELAPLIDLSEGQSTTAALSSGLISQSRRLCDRLPECPEGEFDEWLGCYLTEPKLQFLIDRPENQWTAASLLDWLAQGRELVRHPWARLCWARTRPGRVALFGNGESLEFDETWEPELDWICRHRRITREEIDASESAPRTELLLRLLNAGLLEPSES